MVEINIIDTQNINCLAVARSAQREVQKTGEKVAALSSPFLSTKSSGATATVKMAPLQ
jgi:hypothetical protein